MGWRNFIPIYRRVLQTCSLNRSTRSIGARVSFVPVLYMDVTSATVLVAVTASILGTSGRHPDATLSLTTCIYYPGPEVSSSAPKNTIRISSSPSNQYQNNLGSTKVNCLKIPQMTVDRSVLRRLSSSGSSPSRRFYSSRPCFYGGIQIGYKDAAILS